MARHPPGDPDADGRQFVAADPDTRQPIHAGAQNPEIGRRSNQNFLEVAHIPVNVAPIRLQVDDRIADHLPGTVISDIAAAPRLEHFNASCRQYLGCRKDVGAPAVASHAERQNVRVLDQQQRIVDPIGFPVFHQRSLQFERFGVRHSPEPANGKGPPYTAAGSQFSSARLTCDMK